MHYRARDPATDDLYEAIMYSYWGAQDYARSLLVEIVDKYEQGGYSVEAQQKEKAAEAAISDDDIDYDEAAALGDNRYVWEGWQFNAKQ